MNKNQILNIISFKILFHRTLGNIRTHSPEYIYEKLRAFTNIPGYVLQEEMRHIEKSKDDNSLLASYWGDWGAYYDKIPTSSNKEMIENIILFLDVESLKPGNICRNFDKFIGNPDYVSHDPQFLYKLHNNLKDEVLRMYHNDRFIKVHEILKF